MSTALPDKAILLEINNVSDDKRSVSADRLLDQYHQLVCTVTDVQDVERFFARSLQRLRISDHSLLSFLGITGFTPGTEDDPEPGTALPDEGMRRVIAPFGKLVLEQQQQLGAIAASLRRLHPPDKEKLLNEADTALRIGMRATGRDRLEDLRDALRLLRTVQADPVSGRDYFVWFQVGWILWQLEGDLTQAEEAFYQAARLSAPTADFLHTYSLRHQAYLQYLQGKHKPAYTTIGKALSLLPDDDETLYDASRYAARVQKESEALGYLERCFSRNPLFLIYALAEEDFNETGLTPRLHALIAARREQEVSALRNELSRWRRTVTAVREAEQQSQVGLPLSPTLSEEAIAEYTSIDLVHTDYFSLRDATGQVGGKAGAALAEANATLDRSIQAIDAEIEKYQGQIDQIKKNWELWRGTMKWLEKEAKEAGFSLQPGGPMEKLRLRMQRKLDRVQDARGSYEQAKDNLALAVEQVKEQVPGLEKSITSLKERRNRMTAAQEWLSSQEI